MLERIKMIYIICNGKNDFGARTNRFSNRVLERIMVENQGFTVPDTKSEQFERIAEENFAEI